MHISKKDNTLYILFKTTEHPDQAYRNSIKTKLFSFIKAMRIPSDAYDAKRIEKRINAIKKGDTSQIIISRKTDNEYVKIDTQKTAYAKVIKYKIYRNEDKKTYTLCSDQEHKKEIYLMLAKGYDDKITKFSYPDEVKDLGNPVYIGEHMLV